jgi:dihydrofolate reductase
MRSVRYGVAMSLDGYIAGPNGEFDWIVMDPHIDFEALSSRFDTYVMGRKTFEVTRAMAGDAPPSPAGVRTIVISRTLRRDQYPDVTISADLAATMGELRETSGKDIWLYGGGELFRSALEQGFVDGVDVAVIPVLLGSGIPLLPPTQRRVTLVLKGHRLYSKSGIMSLDYDVKR